MPLWVSVTETVAPASTPPVWSETAPVIRPVDPPCEKAGMAATSAVKQKPESAFEVLAKLAHTHSVRAIGYKNPLWGRRLSQPISDVAEFCNYLSASKA